MASNPTPHPRAVLSSDTSPAAEDVQVRLWRGMSSLDKAQLIIALSRSADAMALAGVRRDHPTASGREQFLRLAVRRLGKELASRAYPEVAALSDLS